MAQPIYHLEAFASDCHAVIGVNGFPAVSLTSANGVPVTFAPPINPCLCGARNTLEVTIHPALRAGGRPTSFGDASVRGSVKRYDRGGIVAPDTGEVVVGFGITDELRERVREEKLELPVSFTVPFATEGVDFSAELLDGPVFSDRDALLAYALRLRDLLASGDGAALAEEMEAKAQVWSRAYLQPAEVYSRAIREGLSELASGRPAVDFDGDQLELTPCCGGRVWGLARKGGLPLLQVEFPDGSSSRIPVFAGVRDGALRVVR